jgi:hypothetical protein
VSFLGPCDLLIVFIPVNPHHKMCNGGWLWQNGSNSREQFRQYVKKRKERST